MREKETEQHRCGRDILTGCILHAPGPAWAGHQVCNQGTCSHWESNPPPLGPLADILTTETNWPVQILSSYSTFSSSANEWMEDRDGESQGRRRAPGCAQAKPGVWAPFPKVRPLHQGTQPPECGFPKFSNRVWRTHICQLPRQVCEEVMAERAGSEDWF